MKKLLRVVSRSRVGSFFRIHCAVFVNSLLVFALTLSLVYSLVTSFDLRIRHFITVLFFAAVSGGFVYISGNKRWKRLYLCAGAGALLCGAVMRRRLFSSVVRLADCLIWFVRDYFGKASGESPPEQRNVTAVLLLFGSMCAWLFAFVIVKGESLWWMLFPAAPVAILCFGIRSPDYWCAFILVTVAGVLLLTQRTRLRSQNDGAKLAAVVSLPVVLLFGAIFAVWPPSEYDSSKPPYSLRYELQDLGWFMLDVFTGNGNSGENEFVHTGYDGVDEVMLTEWMDLYELGPQTLSNEVVMSVYTEQEGILYLRGQAFSLFSDNYWSPCTADDLTDMHFMDNSYAQFGDCSYITIETENPHSVLYVPYIATAVSCKATMYGDAYLLNDNGSKSYSVEYSDNPNRFDDDAYYGFVLSNCTYLDPVLSAQLYRLAEKAGITDRSLDSAGLAGEVREYIMSSASYDLSPDYPPEGSDPVIWFLTEGKRGYCVHFASACAAMLRSLGVPARVVTGYCVYADGTGWVDVRGKNAHAWTEYYDPQQGWMMVDATGESNLSGFGVIDIEPDEATVSDGDQGEQPQSSPSLSATDTQPQKPEKPGAFTDAQPEGVHRAGEDWSTGDEQPGENPVSESDAGNQVSADGFAPAVGAVVCLMLAAASLVFANLVVVRVREEKMTGGTPESRAETMWKYVLRVCVELNEEPDEAMRGIVLKARFSRASAAEDELLGLYGYVSERRNMLREADNVPSMLIHRYLHFLY